MGIFSDFFISLAATASDYESRSMPPADVASYREITVVELSSLVALVDGKDSNRGIVNSFLPVLRRDGGKTTIQRLPDSFVTRLAAMTTAEAGTVVAGWSRTRHMAKRSEAAQRIIDDLRRLAKLARRTGRTVFLWNSFYPRIRPYRTRVFAKAGAAKRLEAYEILLRRASGEDLEINLAPHPVFGGSVTISTFNGSLVLDPTASDSLNVFVEKRQRGKPRRMSNRLHDFGVPWQVHAVDSRGGMTLLSAIAFSVELGLGISLRVDLSPAAPWAQHVALESTGGTIDIVLGAGNVAHVSVYAGSRSPRRRRWVAG